MDQRDGGAADRALEQGPLSQRQAAVVAPMHRIYGGKVYRGHRDGRVTVEWRESRNEILRIVGVHVSNSSGAAIAVAILCDALKDQARALKLHQRFAELNQQKFASRAGWALHIGDVLLDVQRIERGEK